MGSQAHSAPIDLCGFEPEKHRRAILAHNLLRKLEEATEESLEGEGNREVDA